MTKVKDILSISLKDDIKSVVDIDVKNESDEEKISELNDFILTESLAKHLEDFCDHYVTTTYQPGIWLSGFYGSGKSFFAKILGYLLENETWKGTSVRDRFVPKLQGLSNASLLQNDIDEIIKMKNLVVKFDISKHNNEHGVSFMLMENFLRTLDCMGNDIGLWEFDMKNEGKYDEFCNRVQQKAGRPWSEVRKQRGESRKVFREVMLDWKYDDYDFQQTVEDYKNHIKTYDATKLAEDLGKYLAKHPDIHIVFFLDEVSEAINQDRVKIDEFEGMAEALWGFKNHVWTIAIAQQRLDDVVNAAKINRNSITKMTDRFKKGININAEEIDTIIRQRLLSKNELGNRELTAHFNENNGQITDITSVGGGLPITDKASTYADYYPFFAHQFRLLQYFLFGNSPLASSQGGTRGMLLSTFDVLRKEAMKDSDLFDTVNSIQLCRQAELNVDSALKSRYDQADGVIKEAGFQNIKGSELLIVIHFLTKAGTVKTTPENITKSCVRDINDYYSLLSEIRKALDLLVDSQVLILTEGQYRITSEAEQRILDKKRKLEEDIPHFQINSYVNKRLQLMPFVRNMQSAQIGELKVSFYVGIRDGEPFYNSDDKDMKFLLSGLFNVAPTDSEYVEKIKTDTQSEKGEANLIPSTEYNDKIFELVRDIISMEYLDGDTTYTSEEKLAVQVILNTREEKVRQLESLIRKAYTEGSLVYCYDAFKVSEDKLPSLIGDLQTRMYGNIFYRRLSGSLSDKLAGRVFHTNVDQLYKLFGSNEEFQFFDKSGKFIGDNLSVVTEITALSKQYVNGSDLEKKLQAPPTGFDYGTIVTTVAALFRGDKMTVKFGGNEYHSWKDKGVEDIFTNSRNFGKASFKSVVVTLSYKEKQEIVDTLKDCRYTELTGYKLNYQVNDYELVQAIATLAHTERQKVFHQIFGDDEREKLFKGSMNAYKVLQDYDGTVTDANYLQTAHKFLDENNNEDYVDAVERIEKDIFFIDHNFDEIHNEQEYIGEVAHELSQSEIVQDEFNQQSALWQQMQIHGVVSNFKKMQETTQKIRDIYHDVMKQQADNLTDKYLTVGERLEGFTKKLAEQQKAWNEGLWKSAGTLQKLCERLTTIKLDIPKLSVMDKVTGYALHDFVNQIQLANNWFTKIDLWETQIRTTPPAPPTPPTPPTPPDDDKPKTPQPPKPEPKPQVVPMKSKLPTGKRHVNEYKSWLMQQLSMVNQMKGNEIIDFDA